MPTFLIKMDKQTKLQTLMMLVNFKILNSSQSSKVMRINKMKRRLISKNKLSKISKREKDLEEV